MIYGRQQDAVRTRNAWAGTDECARGADQCENVPRPIIMVHTSAFDRRLAFEDLLPRIRLSLNTAAAHFASSPDASASFFSPCLAGVEMKPALALLFGVAFIAWMFRGTCGGVYALPCPVRIPRSSWRWLAPFALLLVVSRLAWKQPNDRLRAIR